MRGIRGRTASLAWIFPVLALAAGAVGPHPEAKLEFPPPPAWALASPPAPAPRAFTEDAQPNEVRAEIVRWFTKAGYRDIQVDALVQHAKIESGFRPCAANGSSLRYTYQWGGLRLRRLQEFAGTRDCPPLDKQLAFTDYELRNEPNYSCFWRASTGPAALTALRRGFGHGSC